MENMKEEEKNTENPSHCFSGGKQRRTILPEIVN
jgi:hypothetical protein